MYNSTKTYVQDTSARFTEECVWFSLRKATRATTQLFDEILRPSGVRATQLCVLAIVAVAEATTITSLAEELAMNQTTMSRNLRPLERQGLIKIVEGEDRRTRAVTLTPKGEAVTAEALTLWEQTQDAIVQELGNERAKLLLETLSAGVSVLSKLKG
jgi:DNA-binding MarR family transcriptional regulator